MVQGASLWNRLSFFIDFKVTWKTVSKAAVIELKLEVGVPSGKLKKPPKSCIPRRAKMKMNRKRRKSNDKIEDMAFIRAITRFLNEDQYLFCKKYVEYMSRHFLCKEKLSYFVTLKTLNNRKALKADRPKLPARSWKFTQNTSKTDPVMTIESNRLKEDAKKVMGPRAYIRINISKMKAPRNMNST